jgi:gluconolactonase
MTRRATGTIGVFTILAIALAAANENPPAEKVKPVQLFKLPEFTEGIVFDRDGNGYISSGKVVYRFAPGGKPAVWAETGGPNGHKILPDGTHLLCDRSHKAVLHVSADGKLLGEAAKAFDGKPLNAPNDLTLDVANGGFYFSDPNETDDTMHGGAIYYVDSAGKVSQVDKGLAYPNGIALTLDGKRLYLGTSLTNTVNVYDVQAPGKLGPRRLFAELPNKDASKGHIENMPDGMCLDAAGNLYVAHFGMRQVEVLDPSGKRVASHSSGNLSSSNVAFGGPKNDQLFVTGALGKLGASEGAVFRLDLGVKGQPLLPAGAK